MDPLPFLFLAIVLFVSLQIFAVAIWKYTHKQQLHGIGVVKATDFIKEKKTKRRVK